MKTTALKSDLKHKTIFISKHLDLPLNEVWKGWTDCERFKKWWGPKNYTSPFCEIDLKVGGKYLVSMRSKDGRENYSTGIYKEIVLNKKLVMTDNFSDSNGKVLAAPKEMEGDWSEELVISIDLRAEEGGTVLTLEHTGIPAEQYEDCIQGWDESLGKLETNLKWHSI